MRGATHGGKGSGRRPESGGDYASGWDNIDWSHGREEVKPEPVRPEPACGTCDTPIKSDALTGTTCACAGQMAAPDGYTLAPTAMLYGIVGSFGSARAKHVAALEALLNAPPPSAADRACADDAAWIVKHLADPDKAARGPHRGIEAIRHVAARLQAALEGSAGAKSDA